MYELASVIRERFAELQDQFDQHLQKHPDYAAMPADFRQAAAGFTLSFVADWVTSGDDHQLIEFIRERARERSGQGLDMSMLQHAVNGLEAVIEPHVRDVETAKFVWRSLSRAHDAITQVATEATQISAHRLQESLERRGRQVRTSTEIAQEIAAAPALDELFRRVVTLIKERFDYYHAQIFRYDAEQDAVVLVASYGEAGRKMLAAGHKLAMGRGVVGTAAATGQAILAADVAQDKDWRPNPNLPDTQGELAVPIKLRDEVLGILDVQSAQAGALTAEAQLLLEGLCGQIAIAIDNKRTGEALAREQYLLRTFLDNSPDHIYFKDTQSRFIRVSKSQSSRFGFSDPAQAIGKTDFDFFTEEHARPAYEAEQTIMRTGQPLTLEELETWPDRPASWVLTTKQPLRDEAGNIVGTFGVSRDITERKQTEAKMQQTMQELERLYRATAREGWQAFRDTGERPTGYLFDRATVQPQAQVWVPQVEQAVRQKALVPPTGEQPAAVVPLAIRGEIIGALGVYDDPQNPLSPEDLELVQQITEQGALALESARLSDQTQTALREAQQRAAEMATLNELSQKLTGRLSLDEILDETYRGVSQLMDASSLYVALYDPEKEEISFPLAVEDHARVAYRSRRAARHGLTEHIIRTKTPILIPEDVPGRLAELGITPTGRNSLSWLGVPMMTGDRVLGVIAAQSYTTPRTYGEHELDMLTVVASQASIALQNANLFEQTQVSLGEARTLYEASRRVSSAADPQEMLAAVVEGVRVPEINRAMLWDVASSVTGEPEAFILTGNWHSGTGAQPLSVGTHLALKQFPAAHLATADDPVFVQDVESDERVGPVARALLQQQQVRGLALLPLRIGNRQLGLLMLTSEEPHLFVEKETRPYTSLARQVAIAMENRRLLEQSRAALEEVEATHRRYLREQWETYLSGAQAKSTAFLDSATGLRATEGAWLPEMEQALEVGEPIVVAAQGESQRAALAVPLKLRGAPIGVVEFYDEGSARDWSTDERALVAALADQAVLALENARLFEETQSRAQREQLINEITARIRASTDMETIMRTTAEELARTLNLSRARIRLNTGNK